MKTLLYVLPCLLVWSCGSTPPAKQGTREAILNATRPIPVAPVDPTDVAAGIDSVGKASSDVSLATSEVEAANRRLSEALRSKDAAFDQQRKAFQELSDATDKAMGEAFKRIEEQYERKRIQFVVLVAEQKDNISKLATANKELAFQNTNLRKDKDELIASAEANRITKLNEDKHSKVSIDVVGDTEGEIAVLQKNVTSLTKENAALTVYKRIVQGIISIILLYLFIRFALPWIIRAFKGGF